MANLEAPIGYNKDQKKLDAFMMSLLERYSKFTVDLFSMMLEPDYKKRYDFTHLYHWTKQN